MYAQVDSRIAVEDRPGEDRQGNPPVPENKRKEDSQAKTVGGMPGYKSKSSAPVVVNGIYQLPEIGMVRGTESFKKGLEQPRRNLVAQGKQQNKKFKKGLEQPRRNLVAQGKQQNKKNGCQNTFPSRRPVEKHDHKKQQQRYPNEPAGKSPEELVQKN